MPGKSGAKKTQDKPVRIPRVNKSVEHALATGGYLSTLQVGRLIGVSTLSVQRWFDDGLLYGAKLPGGKRMIEAASFREFLKKQGIKIPARVASSHPVVLVVHPDHGVMAQIQSTLEATEKYQVHACGALMAAGGLIASKHPDCIVIDVRNEEMDGPTLLRIVRNMLAGRTVWIVAITGKVSAAEADKLTKAGANQVVTSPFQMKEIEHAVTSGFDLVMAR
jgi:CheY-like chemotaxis protein